MRIELRWTTTGKVREPQVGHAELKGEPHHVQLGQTITFDHEQVRERTVEPAKKGGKSKKVKDKIKLRLTGTVASTGWEDKSFFALLSAVKPASNAL